MRYNGGITKRRKLKGYNHNIIHNITGLAILPLEGRKPTRRDYGDIARRYKSYTVHMLYRGRKFTIRNLIQATTGGLWHGAH